jgi:hypothetical protein
MPPGAQAAGGISACSSGCSNHVMNCCVCFGNKVEDVTNETCCHIAQSPRWVGRYEGGATAGACGGGGSGKDCAGGTGGGGRPPTGGAYPDGGHGGIVGSRGGSVGGRGGIVGGRGTTSDPAPCSTGGGPIGARGSGGGAPGAPGTDSPPGGTGGIPPGPAAPPPRCTGPPAPGVLNATLSEYTFASSSQWEKNLPGVLSTSKLGTLNAMTSYGSTAKRMYW